MTDTQRLNADTVDNLNRLREQLKIMASIHLRRWDSLIGTDHVLGVYWLDMLKGLRGMLNGETGKIDCGAFDATLVQLARDNGFSDDDF